MNAAMIVMQYPTVESVLEMPLGDGHLRRVLKVWVTHYNHGRLHMSLGPVQSGQRVVRWRGA
jgi:transposase InsO family protein